MHFYLHIFIKVKLIIFYKWRFVNQICYYVIYFHREGSVQGKRNVVLPGNERKLEDSMVMESSSFLNYKRLRIFLAFCLSFYQRIYPEFLVPLFSYILCFKQLHNCHILQLFNNCP